VSVDLQLDVIVLSVLRGVASVGIYSAARSIVMFLALLPRTFRIAVYPALARAYATSETELRRVYRQAWWYLAVIGFPLAVGGILVSRHITELVYGPVSLQMVWSFGVLMVYLFVSALYIPGTRLMVASNRQAWLSMLLGLSLALGVLVSVLLVPRLGAVGAAVSRVISAAFYLVTVEWVVLRHLLPKHGGFRMALRPALGAVTMAVVVWFLRDRVWYIVVSLGAVSYGLALLILYGPGIAGRRLGPEVLGE
jgi:O-antigen/teichoic acid export membrane protein